MLMSIPDEVYEYMDMRGDKPKIIGTAPTSVKEKAKEIDRITLEHTGESFFSEIID